VVDLDIQAGHHMRCTGVEEFPHHRRDGARVGPFGPAFVPRFMPSVPVYDQTRRSESHKLRVGQWTHFNLDFECTARVSSGRQDAGWKRVQRTLDDN